MNSIPDEIVLYILDNINDTYHVLNFLSTNKFYHSFVNKYKFSMLGNCEELNLSFCTNIIDFSMLGNVKKLIL